MRTCVKCSGIILNKMQFTSKQALIDMLRFVESQTSFVIKPPHTETPWKQIIGMRNIISHKYLSIDPELIFDITSEELSPLLASLHQILTDIDAGLRDKELGK